MHNSGLVYSGIKVAPAGFCAFDDHGRVVRPEMPIPARLHGSAGSTRKQVTLYDCTGSRNT
jgi:hypothetical protein